MDRGAKWLKFIKFKLDSARKTIKIGAIEHFSQEHFQKSIKSDLFKAAIKSYTRKYRLVPF